MKGKGFGSDDGWWFIPFLVFVVWCVYNIGDKA